MKRDFTESARQELLSLVRQVENDKYSNFTDWAGDRWYDFQDWMGELDISKYVNNVNTYHRKVIDKNNTSEQAIDRIFQSVNQVDHAYRSRFDGTHDDLRDLKRQIQRLSQIISPSAGRFDSVYNGAGLRNLVRELMRDNVQAIVDRLVQVVDGAAEFDIPKILEMLRGDMHKLSVPALGGLAQVLELMRQNVSREHTGTNTTDTKGLSNLLAYLAGVGSMHEEGWSDAGADMEGLGLFSDLLGYVGSLINATDTKGKPATEVASNFLELFKNSTQVEVGLYEVFEQMVLNADEAMKLYQRFGKAMMGLTIAGSSAQLIQGGIGAYEAFVDSASSGYDKAAAGIELSGDVVMFGGNVYIATQLANKAVYGVASNGKVMNQILAVEKKVTTSAATASKVGTAASFISLFDVGANTVAGGVRRYEEVNADGDVDWGDVGSIGIHGAMSGLDQTVNYLTFGAVDMDGEGFADELEEHVDEFVHSDHAVAQILRDEDTNELVRGALSFGTGAVIFAEEVGESVVEKVETVGSWIESGWDAVTSFFGG